MSAPNRAELLAQGRGNGHAVSQATTVEQSRAVAQVQGALVVARQNPRDTVRARHLMQEACALPALAERAFFRFARGGQQVSGASVHLAREIARCWGNVDFGVTELRRDDAQGESEMLAYAWDLETNARVTNGFIVPHMRDKKGGPEPLRELRDIYENNANAAARRLRECIFAVLPTAFVEEAKDLCRATLEHGGGKPLAERRAAMLEAFTALGVRRKAIERKIGRAADQLTAYDLGSLSVIYQSIRRGEASVAEEFPDDTAAEAAAELRKSGGTGASEQPGRAPPTAPGEKDAAASGEGVR